MLTFALAVFFLIITPGPGVLSTAGVGAAFGRADGTRYVWGLFVGNFLVMAAVASGLAGLVLADPRIRLVLFAASVLYLTYLAARIAFAGAKIAFIARARPPGIWGGITLQLINPKAYAVATSLFSGFNFLPAHAAAEIAMKLAVISVIWIPIHFAWLALGITLRAMDLPERAQRRVNMAMAGSMMIVVGLAVWAQISG